MVITIVAIVELIVIVIAYLRLGKLDFKANSSDACATPCPRTGGKWSGLQAFAEKQK